jgi:GT2 family glycosyltransferase
MILPIILHHNTSAEYTRQLEYALQEVDVIVYDSSEKKTSFTQSFNNAIEIFKREQRRNVLYTHVMICNNDINLCSPQIRSLEKIIGDSSGIFTPIVNSPHHKMMEKQSDRELDEVPWIEFICPVISMDVLKAVGILERRLSLGWGIDLDYCYRSKLMGYKNFLLNNISVTHYEHKSQENYQEYSREATLEMNNILRLKYGSEWRSILNFT